MIGATRTLRSLGGGAHAARFNQHRHNNLLGGGVARRWGCASTRRFVALAGLRVLDPLG